MQRTLLLILVVLPMLFISCAEEMKPISEELKELKGDIYVEPSPSDLEKAEEVFAAHFRGEGSDVTHELWKELHFIPKKVTYGGKVFLFVSEEEGHRTGRGCFLIRLGEMKPVVIQTPHVFHDKLTDKIGMAMMKNDAFAAIGFNTVHRKASVQGDDSRLADLARLTESYFGAMTRAFIQVFQHGTVVQIHGFAQEKRKEEKAKEASYIISEGNSKPGKVIQDLKDTLNKDMAGKALLYPIDTKELSARRNATGKILRKMGKGTLLHIEISKEVRELLSRHSQEAEKLSRCVFKHIL